MPLKNIIWSCHKVRSDGFIVKNIFEHRETFPQNMKIPLCDKNTS